MSIDVVFRPGSYRVSVAPGETILEAVNGHGYRAPNACRNGVCHVCVARLLCGDPGREGVLAPALPGHPPSVLICKAQPLSDCELEMTNLYPPGVVPAREMAAQIHAVRALSGDVHEVDLLTPAGIVPDYHAGQYLQLLIPGHEGAYFSIANAPGSRHLQLHILAVPGQSSACEIVEYLRNRPTVRLRLPMGRCCLTSMPASPLVLVAAGTGFAQIKSMVEWLILKGHIRPVHVYWAVRRPEERYAAATFSSWTQLPWLRCVGVTGDSQDNDWTGHHAELVRALCSNPVDWQQAEVYVSGSPPMVYAVQDALRPLGLADHLFHSDVLDYAPR